MGITLVYLRSTCLFIDDVPWQGAFLHRNWLSTYTEAMPRAVLQYVDDHRNCEDLAMAFLVANATESPPVYIRAPGLRDLGQGVRKVRKTKGRMSLPVLKRLQCRRCMCGRLRFVISAKAGYRCGI